MRTVTLHCADGRDVVFDGDLLVLHSKVFADMLSVPLTEGGDEVKAECTVVERAQYFEMLRTALTEERYNIGGGTDAQAFAHLVEYDILHGKRVVADQAWRWSCSGGNFMSLRAYTLAAIIGDRVLMDAAAVVSLPLHCLNLKYELLGCPDVYAARLRAFYAERTNYYKATLLKPVATVKVMTANATKTQRCFRGNLKHADAELWNMSVLELMREARPDCVPYDDMLPKALEMMKEVGGCQSCMTRIMAWLAELKSAWSPPCRVYHSPAPSRSSSPSSSTIS